MLHLTHKDTSGKLPTLTYELFDGEAKVGMIQIRHASSHGIHVPEHMDSHIYYEIIPEYRSKGYGKKILTLGLVEAKKIGLEKIYITCMENNIASKNIIESHSAVFIDKAFISQEGEVMFKYSIALQ